MKLPAIITTDLHLTAKPRDNYRWDLFPWLVQQIKIHKCKTVAILGDITDAKDFHGSTLVNRLVREIVEMSRHVDELLILRGNHDYLTEHDLAFFEFLQMFPKIRFITEPDDSLDDVSCLWLPHTRTPRSQWHDLLFQNYDYVFMHQTVSGSIASNGMAMEGELDAEFDGVPLIQIYSGDIHVPQDIGNVRYVGSPYHVHFGDKFVPRCIVIDKDCREHSIHFETLHRVTIVGTPDEVHARLGAMEAGDQVKVRLQLEDGDNWDIEKRGIVDQCLLRSIELHGIEMLPREHTHIRQRHAEKVSSQTTTAGTVTEFVNREDLGGEVLDTGLEILRK